MMKGVEFRWADHAPEPGPARPHRRDHPDPTADQAISNVMREERKKRRKVRTDASKKKRRVSVWHAPERGEAYEGE